MADPAELLRAAAAHIRSDTRDTAPLAEPPDVAVGQALADVLDAAAVQVADSRNRVRAHRQLLDQLVAFACRLHDVAAADAAAAAAAASTTGEPAGPDGGEDRRV